MPFDIATNKSLKNGRAFRSRKLAFNPVVSGCLAHGLAAPLHLRGGDFLFRLDGKMVHKKVPFYYGTLRSMAYERHRCRESLDTARTSACATFVSSYMTPNF